MTDFIRQTLHSLVRRLENSNEDNLDSVSYRIDWLYNSLVRYVGVYDLVSEQVISLIRDAKDLLQILVSQNDVPHSYRVEQVSNGGRGRPRFDVSKEQLEFLLERGFSVPAVAQILGISVRTTERRLQEFGISATQLFTLINDQTLDRTIEDIKFSFV